MVSVEFNFRRKKDILIGARDIHLTVKVVTKSLKAVFISSILHKRFNILLLNICQLHSPVWLT